MKSQKSLVILSLLVAILAAVAAGLGVFGQGQGSSFDFISLRGETVSMFGHGLYKYDTVSGAAQVIAGDIITLVLGIPLLLVSIYFTARGSLRGRLLLTGTLGYFLYTYMSIAMLLAYNNFFLLYVALFSLSLFAFVAAMMSFDLKTLPGNFSSKTPRIPVAVFLFVIALFLAMNWIGRIILPALLNGSVPSGLETYATLVIQAMDLGIIVPAAVLGGVLWLKRSAFGYLLVPVILIKGLTMSAAVTAMTINMRAVGAGGTSAADLMFPAIALIDAVLMFVVLKNVKSDPEQKAI
ncbi:MAG: hypothetical protein HGA86_02180 [Anaerolineaceae bacterium]|nr:hypothetical protein [Anaerolineaceae bacterium]